MILNFFVSPSLKQWSAEKIGASQQPCQIYTGVESMHAMSRSAAKVETRATSRPSSGHKSGIMVIYKNK